MALVWIPLLWPHSIPLLLHPPTSSLIISMLSYYSFVLPRIIRMEQPPASLPLLQGMEQLPSITVTTITTTTPRMIATDDPSPPIMSEGDQKSHAPNESQRLFHYPLDMPDRRRMQLWFMVLSLTISLLHGFRKQEEQHSCSKNSKKKNQPCVNPFVKDHDEEDQDDVPTVEDWMELMFSSVGHVWAVTTTTTTSSIPLSDCIPPISSMMLQDAEKRVERFIPL